MWKHSLLALGKKDFKHRKNLVMMSLHVHQPMKKWCGFYKQRTLNFAPKLCCRLWDLFCFVWKKRWKINCQNSSMSLFTDTCYCFIWNVDGDGEKNAVLVLIPLKLTIFFFFLERFRLCFQWSAVDLR